MKLIVGLGNPGTKYDRTRHNFGFLAIEECARVLQFSLNDQKHDALSGTTTLDQEKVIFCEPQTFMNRSGKSVASFAQFYKIAPQDILVIHDDLDLPLGRLRLATGGTAAGHNGIKSIIEHLGTQGFCRLKLGIGRPVHPGIEVVDFVLQNFAKSEFATIHEIITLTPQIVKDFVVAGMTAAMNRYNGTNLVQNIK